MNYPTVCVIAGSDPSGAAGFQMDLRVLSLLGIYATAVPSAFTVQGLDTGISWESSPPALFGKALKEVLSSLSVKVIKIGMLGSTAVALEVARALEDFSGQVILDPVLRASSGLPLTEEGVLSVMRERLLPRITLFTPNLPEAEAILGQPIPEGQEDKVVRDLWSLGPQAVLLKGGHRQGPTVRDFFFDGSQIQVFERPRIEGRFRGTGCFLSSAIAGILAKGRDLRQAIEEALELLETALLAAKDTGVSPAAAQALILWERNALGRKILEDLQAAAEKFVRHPVRPLIPEVQCNLAYALPYARTIEEVAAFPGRIVAYGEGAKVVGCPRFGASSHVARIVLTVMRFDPYRRSALNVRFDPRFLTKAEKLGFRIGWFSRKEEPEEVKRREGGTLSWGVKKAIREVGFVPDLIADQGDVGKEPMIRILAEDPFQAVEIALKLL